MASLLQYFLLVLGHLISTWALSSNTCIRQKIDKYTYTVASL